MATGMEQKSYKALFPLWSLRKKRCIEINKIKNHVEAGLKVFERILILKQRQRWNCPDSNLHEF